MNKPGSFFYGWVIVAAGFLINMVFGVEYIYGIFFKSIAFEFGWSRTATSFAYSLFTLMSSFLGILMGKIVDKYGPRLAVECGALMFGLGMVLSYWIHSLWHLYFLFGIVVGFGISPMFIAPISTATKWFIEKKGVALGIVVSGIGVGGLVFPPFTEYILSAYGWRMAFAVFGVIVWVITIPTGLLLKNAPEKIEWRADGGRAETKMRHSRSAGFTVAEALKTSQFWTLYFLHFCACVVLTLILVHLVPFLTDIGFSRMIAASALGLVGGSSIIGRLGMGSVSDRIGRKNALTICFIIQAIVIISLMAIKSIWMIFAFAVIFGFSYGGWVPQFPAITVELFGTRSFSTILGLTISSYGFGGTIGPTLGGYVFDITGNYFLALSLSVFLCGLSALLSFLIKPLSLKTR